MTVINAFAASVLPFIRHIASSSVAFFGNILVAKPGMLRTTSGCVVSNTKTIHVEHTEASRQNRPVRMVRVVEAGQSRSNAGRMVISGRMADVCAELDRLVARESASSKAHSLPC